MRGLREGAPVTHEVVDRLRREIARVRTSLETGERALAALHLGEVPFDLPELVGEWKNGALARYLESERRVLVPWMERAGFRRGAHPILLYREDWRHAEVALNRVLFTMASLPEDADGAAEALTTFLRITRLRIELAEDVAALMREALEERGQLPGAERLAGRRAAGASGPRAPGEGAPE